MNKRHFGVFIYLELRLVLWYNKKAWHISQEPRATNKTEQGGW